MTTTKNKFDAIIKRQDFKKQGWLETYQPFIQTAFHVVALVAANDLLVAIWRTMTGH
jgi:hypothetical protein